MVPPIYEEQIVKRWMQKTHTKVERFSEPEVKRGVRGTCVFIELGRQDGKTLNHLFRIVRRRVPGLEGTRPMKQNAMGCRHSP